MTFGAPTSSKAIAPRPPEKGSFPLDHDAECKISVQRYMDCLKENNNVSTNCRAEMKTYLQCRMDRGLMAPEEWKNLGFSEVEEPKAKVSVVNDQHTKEASGFVAGTGIKK